MTRNIKEMALTIGARGRGGNHGKYTQQDTKRASKCSVVQLKMGCKDISTKTTGSICHCPRNKK